jgi:tetratricopeptide (TPR) repeat protein
MHLLLESRVVSRLATEWSADEKALAERGLPASHEELTAERVRVMPASEREVLEKAAVVGERFWLDSVVALLRSAQLSGDPDGPPLDEIAAAGDHSRAQVSRALSRLLGTGWIAVVDASQVPGEREYRFIYPQLWSIVYQGIDPAERKSLHRVVAQWLELRAAGRDFRAQELAGFHLEQAGEPEAAAARYRRAADGARGDFLNNEAIRLYSRALDCLDPADLSPRIHVWHDLGSIYEMTGDYQAALNAFERMLRLSWVGASRVKAAVAFNKTGRIWRRKGDLALALEYLERGRELFEEAGDARGIAGSLDDIGTVLHLMGRSDEAHAVVSRGLALRGERGKRRSLARSLSNLGNIQRARGLPAEAHDCHHKALELRRQIGDRVGVVSSLSDLAALAYERGDLSSAKSGWEQALAEAEEIGALPFRATTACRLGELALDLENLAAARHNLEDALTITEDLEERRLLADVTALKARLERLCGTEQEAARLAQRAYDLASAAGLRDCQARALLALAELAKPVPARSLWSRAIDILRRLESRFELARGLERYGRYQLAAGDRSVALGALQEAVSLYRQRGGGRARALEESLL